MNLHDKYNERFKEFIKRGDGILQKYGWTGQEYPHNYPATDEFNQWYASAKNLIEKTCDKDSGHYKQFDDLYAKNSGNSYFLAACMGVFKAAYEDFESGMLEDVRTLITAEVFTDFIEQAEYLLGEHYKLPAAVLTGAVLEDGLRTLCNKKGIQLGVKTKLETMNVELCKAGVYNKTVQKQVTAWSAVRNSAAHGRDTEFDESNVRDMISGIINFNSSYLK